jgi:L-aminopeptidase/D-esterase-like protein
MNGRWRSIMGMARTGSDFSGRSGDYALAFPTVEPGPELAGPRLLPDSALDPPPASPSPFMRRQWTPQKKPF